MNRSKNFKIKKTEANKYCYFLKPWNDEEMYQKRYVLDTYLQKQLQFVGVVGN